MHALIIEMTPLAALYRLPASSAAAAPREVRVDVHAVHLKEAAARATET